MMFLPMDRWRKIQHMVPLTQTETSVEAHHLLPIQCFLKPFLHERRLSDCNLPVEPLTDTSSMVACSVKRLRSSLLVADYPDSTSLCRRLNLGLGELIVRNYKLQAVVSRRKQSSHQQLRFQSRDFGNVTMGNTPLVL